MTRLQRRPQSDWQRRPLRESRVQGTLETMVPARRAASRRGVSVLEVLFATGIAITGLLGIAALLLMSGRDASVANQSTESQALARAWYGDFLIRGFQHPSAWLRFQDHTFPPGSGPGWYGVSKVLPSVAGAPRPTFSTGSRPPVHAMTQGKVGICIDPYFYSSRDVWSVLGNYTQPAAGGAPWYRPAVFPYYQDGANPLVDPRLTIGATANLAWTDQPRMLRVSIRSGPGSLVPMVDAMVRKLFASQDELVVLGDEELKQAGVTRPAPTMRRFQPLTANAPGANSLGYRYSWLATLSPLERTIEGPEDLYTLSLVVIAQRDRLFQTSVRTGGVPDPRSTPQGERLIWVLPQSGNFVGGNGGRVRLIFSSAFEEHIRVGDWLMLAKHIGFKEVAGAPGVVEPFSVFRWFRVVSVDGESTLLPPNSIPDPWGGSNQEPVWAVDVALIGPDWSFAPAALVQGPSGISIPTPTTATLVKGAVAVYERVVEIPDL